MTDLNEIVSPSRHDQQADRPADLIFTNAAIVLEHEVIKGTVRVLDGMISDIDQSATAIASAIDLEGDYLLPGLVDVHTDHLEKQSMPRPGMFWNSVNAATTHDIIVCAGGTTTVFDSLVVGAVGNPHRRALLPLMIEGLQQARQQDLLRVDHFLHLRCDAREEKLLDLLDPYLDDPLLRFVTIMDDSPSRDVDRFERASRRKKMPEEAIQSEIALASSSKASNENNRARIVELCRERGLPLASHDDTRIDHIAEAEAFGMTISEFPISMEAAQAAHDAGMAVIAGGPNIVAGRSHIDNVSGSALAAKGLVDVVCSDYIPASLLHALWALTRSPVGLDLPRAVVMGTKRPAELFGFTDRGEIAIGRRADLIRVRDRAGVPVVGGTWLRGRAVL